jgi:predicted aspartyl protease
MSGNSASIPGHGAAGLDLQLLLALLLTSVRPVAASGGSVEEADRGVDERRPAELYAVPTTADRAGRILAPVEINGRGPYRFILDTGANSSALAPRVAEALALPAAQSAVLGVHGVTGMANLPAVWVEKIQAGEIAFEQLAVPVLGSTVFAEADGILGVDGLQDARIEVDFTRNRVSISRSTGRRDRDGALLVRAELRHGGLLLVDGKVGRIPVKALIDTGAERSLGNMALYDELASRSRRPSEVVSTTVAGATPGLVTGTSLRTPTVRIGEARLRNMVVTFGDLHVFKVWGLTEEPALLIGMDLLGTLQRFVVDYPRREFLLKSMPSGVPGIRRCGGTECQTRIPEG